MWVRDVDNVPVPTPVSTTDLRATCLGRACGLRGVVRVWVRDVG